LQREKAQEAIDCNQNVENDANRQVDTYLKEPLVDPENDPLNFWRVKETSYPELAQV